MRVRVGINGFGRIGRLLTRILAQSDQLTLSHINDPACPPAMAAHLLAFDSTHGRWNVPVVAEGTGMTIGGQRVSMSQERAIAAVDWGNKVDIVVDCSGRFKAADELQPYLAAGVKKVVLSAPVQGAPNIVLGVNDADYLPRETAIVSAASCTTNCLGVVAKVIHEEFTIRSGFITTIHAITNDQALLDQAHPDWRRGRTAGESLIPTTSGFAKTIGSVIPALNGQLEGYAVRAPVSNASLIDCVFVLEKATDIASVNAALEAAARTSLSGLLGVEARPLVSADYKGDTHSAIVDLALTHMLDEKLLKLVAWYDNETGYSNRLHELVQKIASTMPV